jgi:magnesium chelatase family protein
MLAKVCSAAISGIEAYPVEVEVNAGWGDTFLVIVGLPDAAVKESRDRVVTAITNSGFKFTFGRTTINLAPADVKKEGPSFDLPIAIGMLAASEQFVTDQLENFVMAGELALNGAIRPIKGTLPIALRARADGKIGILVPTENSAEAAVVSGLSVIPVRNLREAVSFLEGEIKIAPTKVDTARIFEHDHEDEIDFAEVKGQESVKRGLEIAAAGGHNVLILWLNTPATLNAFLISDLRSNCNRQLGGDNRRPPAKTLTIRQPDARRSSRCRIQNRPRLRTRAEGAAAPMMRPMSTGFECGLLNHSTRIRPLVPPPRGTFPQGRAEGGDQRARAQTQRERHREDRETNDWSTCARRCFALRPMHSGGTGRGWSRTRSDIAAL